MLLDLAGKHAVVFLNSNGWGLDDERFRYLASLVVWDLNDCAVVDRWVCKKVSLEFCWSNLMPLIRSVYTCNGEEQAAYHNFNELLDSVDNEDVFVA